MKSGSHLDDDAGLAVGSDEANMAANLTTLGFAFAVVKVGDTPPVADCLFDDTDSRLVEWLTVAVVVAVREAEGSVDAEKHLVVEAAAQISVEIVHDW